MARYHLNPKTGNPGKCSAKEGRCPFGADAPHYGSLEEARAAYETSMAIEDVEEAPLADRVDDVDFDELEAYVNASRENYEAIDAAVLARAEAAWATAHRLAAINPWENEESKCDKPTFKVLRDEANGFRDRTAMLVEALQASPHHQPAYVTKDLENVGQAIRSASHPHGSREWLEARFDTVGGSDVGVLAVADFVPSRDRTVWERNGLDRAEKSKIALPTDEEIKENQARSYTSRSGALYRGTAWEDRIRDQVAKDHPEMLIINAKDQYRHPEREWQQLNVDGLLADKDGKIDGILEIKTGGGVDGWDKGVPVAYRAQVLYYLNATGLNKAMLAACINDKEFRYYTLYKDDSVNPAGGANMEEYIADRVAPWFDGLKAQRAA